MRADDPLVAALISLCKREGDHKAVADGAKVSAANLKQIIDGVALPSGNLRGVGPQLRDKLTKKYPNWLSIAVPGQDHLKQLAPYSLNDTLDQLAVALRAVPEIDRESVSRRLAALALAPDSAQLVAALKTALAPGTTPDGPARVKPEHQEELANLVKQAEARKNHEQKQQRRSVPRR